MTTPPDAAHPTPPAPLDGARLVKTLRHAALVANRERVWPEGERAKAERVADLVSLAAALPGLLDRQRDAGDVDPGVVVSADWLAGACCRAMDGGHISARSEIGDKLLDYACIRWGDQSPIAGVRARYAEIVAGQVRESRAVRTPSPEAPRV